jgi:hypothetical protein
MFRWWHKWQDRERLAVMDATILIARCGTRASHIANRRVSQMRNGIIFDSNRPPCHWKRVHSIIGELLPYDGDDDDAPVTPAASLIDLGSRENGPR